MYIDNAEQLLDFLELADTGLTAQQKTLIRQQWTIQELRKELDSWGTPTHLVLGDS